MLGYLQDPRLVHEGAHSLVYRGRLDDDRPVIVKLTRDEHPSPGRLAILRREHDLLSRVESSAVARPVGLLEDGYRLALLLDDAGGHSVDRLMGAGVGLDLDRFFRVALDLVDGLAALHAAGVLHLDVKPSNVVVDPRTWHAQLIDLGVGTLTTQSGAALAPRLVGSLPYLPPEQTGRIARPVDARSDLYSLGATLYELLCGRPPFDAASVGGFVHSHLALRPSPVRALRPDCPPGLDELVELLLAKDPDDRYQSAWGARQDVVRVRDAWRGEVDAPLSLRSGDLRRSFPLTGGLYGRQDEEQALLAAVQRAAAGGPPEMLLIAGSSGVGKSALIHHVSRSLASQVGQFVEGKFDQFRRNVPYDSVVQAFRQLTRQLLAEDASSLAVWRSAVLDAVGPNGQVLIDLIPDLELLLGEQPTPAPLGVRAGLNRFGLLLGSVIAVFAQPDSPLVLFLDDLQWADSASLDLLHLLVTDPGCRGLLVVGAYRDDEVQPDHRLLRTTETILHDGGRVTTLPLAPLDAAAITRWLRDGFGGDGDGLAPRASVILEKTGGNPFFVTRFIEALRDDGVLMATPAGWIWDDEALALRTSTDNVAELVSRRIEALPEATQQSLRVAACLGAEVPLSSLAVALAQPARAVALSLEPAVAAGLLLPRSGSLDLVAAGALDQVCVLAFLHDRVQQAAYAAIDPTDRPLVHRSVGRRLLAARADDTPDDGLFAIADHLNSAAAVIDDPAELIALMALDLRAARQARASGAYGPAAGLLDAALSLLPRAGALPEGMERALLLERGVNRAQLARTEDAAVDFAGALDRSRDALERADVRAEWIQGLLYAADYLGVLAQGVAALQDLGIELPPSLEARQDAGLALIGATTEDLDLAGIDALADLPPMTDPVSLRVASILSAISPSAHMTDGSEHWFVWVAFRGLQLCRAHGNSVKSCHNYSLVGMTLCAIGDVERGVAFHRLATALAERCGDIVQLCHTTVCLGFHQPWRESLIETTETARRGWAYSLEAGDWFNAQWATVTLLRASLHSGVSLPELRQDATDCGEFLRHRGPEMAALCAPMVQLVDHLSGAAAEGSPYAAAETPWFDALEPLENEALRVWSQSVGLLALLLDDRDDDVCRLAARIWPRYEVFRRFGDGGELHFIHGLAAARRARDGRADLAPAEEQAAELELWAAESPASYGAKAALVRAAVAEARGDRGAALAGFLGAAALAEQEGIHHVVALASLAAARLQDGNGHPRYARLHRMDARQAWSQWGALRLAAAGPLAADPSRLPRLHVGRSHGGLGGTGAMLDVDTVLAATDAITSVLDLGPLLERVLGLAVENAGADAGVLIRVSESGLRVRARYRPGGLADRYEALDLAIEDVDFVCLRMAHYALRTQEPIVVGEVERDARFARDPHVIASGVRSMLCLPLQRGGGTTALLLLENRLTPHAFGADRVRLLTALSSQMAIALDNAALVQQLERARDDAFARGDDLRDEVRTRDHALYEARRLQTVLFEALSEGVCGLAADGTVALANPAAHVLLGLAPGELIGRAFHQLHHRDADLQGAGGCGLCGIGGAFGADTTFTRADGTPLLVECTARPIPGGSPGVARVLSFRDISARLELESHALQTRKLEAVGQFVARVAHEFNNLLTPLTGHVSWLRSGEEAGTPRAQALDDIEDATGRATGLIQQLLAFNPRSGVVQAPINAVEVATELVGAIRRGGPRSPVVFEPPTHGLWVQADVRQLRQVIGNLVRNAVEAVDLRGPDQPGDGVVRVGLHGVEFSQELAAASGAGAKPGRWVEVAVTDDGPGIAPTTRQRIFEPFFTTKALGQGSGLGLAVVRGTVQQHGGWVTVGARLGGGTEVRAYFPWVDEPGLVRAVRPARARPLVLVVDDEAVVRRVSMMILERAGYDVAEVSDGRMAIEAVGGVDTFDLVLLDLSMPGIDGWETLRQLRTLGFSGPVVLTSGFDLAERRADPLLEQAQGFLPKPFRAKELLAAVAALVRLGPPPDALSSPDD